MKQIDWKAVNEDIKKMSDEVLALALPYAKPTLDDMKAKEEEAKKNYYNLLTARITYEQIYEKMYLEFERRKRNAKTDSI